MYTLHRMYVIYKVSVSVKTFIYRKFLVVFRILKLFMPQKRCKAVFNMDRQCIWLWNILLSLSTKLSNSNTNLHAYSHRCTLVNEQFHYFMNYTLHCTCLKSLCFKYDLYVCFKSLKIFTVVSNECLLEFNS